jgi:hypothetical protein
MDTLHLLQFSLAYGLVMSLLLGILITGSQMINAEMWLDDYPPDIKEKFGAMNKKARQQKAVVSIFFILATLGPIIVSIVHLNLVTQGSLTFGLIFWNVFIITMTFNLFDLLILDWLIFAGITPRFLILPGTEGMDGYNNFIFHARGFLIGSVLVVVFSLVAAGISILVI